MHTELTELRGVCRVGADRWSPLALHAPQLSACGCAPGPRAGMAPAPADSGERRGGDRGRHARLGLRRYVSPLSPLIM
jgi:hypothetical protein